MILPLHKFNKSFCLLLLLVAVFDFLLFNVFLYIHNKPNISLTWVIAILTLIIVLIFSYFVLIRKQWTSWVILIITIAIGYYYLLDIGQTLRVWLKMKSLSWVLRYSAREILIVALNTAVFVYFFKTLIEQRASSHVKNGSIKVDTNPIQQIEHNKLATSWHRFLAIILDVLIEFAVLAIGSGMGYIFAGESGTLVGVAVAMFLNVIFMYFLLVVRRAQTIGKHIMNIYVVDKTTNKRISVWRYWLLRDIVGRTLVIGSLPILNLIIEPFFFLVDSLFIFRKDRSTVHDMIASTKVVYMSEDKKRKSLLDFSRI